MYIHEDLRTDQLLVQVFDMLRGFLMNVCMYCMYVCLSLESAWTR